MNRLRLLTFVVLALRWCCAQQPAKNSEACGAGLRGPVHTVLNEGLNYPDDSRVERGNSDLSVYDRQGYLIEEYHYDETGTLRSHVKYTRDGWRILRTEGVSSVPSESGIVVNLFNSDGQMTGKETYDGGGVLISRTESAFSKDKNGGSGFAEKTTSADGSTAMRVGKTVEQTDPETGLSHLTQTITTNHVAQRDDWLIQQDHDGKTRAFAVTHPDGSFESRENKPDGSIVEHSYYAPTKFHRFQTTNAKGQIVELIDEPEGAFQKTIYRYDDAGRQIEDANYDRSGKLLQRITTTYTDDGYGNWIEARQDRWNQIQGPAAPKLFRLARRLITYY